MSDEEDIKGFINLRRMPPSFLARRVALVSSIAAQQFVTIRLSFVADTGDS